MESFRNRIEAMRNTFLSINRQNFNFVPLPMYENLWIFHFSLFPHQFYRAVYILSSYEFYKSDSLNNTITVNVNRFTFTTYVWILRMEDPQEATITELFGVLLAYTEIMEKHVLFGKCPFHWNKNDQRPHVRFEIFGCFKFWIKLVILTATLAIPCNLIILRFLINKFALFGYCFEDNLPINFISTNISCAVVVGTILLIFLPVMAFWESMAVPEIERTFGIFQRLRKGT